MTDHDAEEREAEPEDHAATVTSDREKLIAVLLRHGHVEWERFDAETVADCVIHEFPALAAPVEVDAEKLADAVADELETDGLIAEEWSAGKIAATARRLVEFAVKPMLRGEGR